MSVIKDLKSKKENNVNVIDFIGVILPNVKTKYIELFLKILMGSIENKYENQIDEARKMLLTLFPENEEFIKNMSTYNLIVFSYYFDIIHETKINIDIFNKFIEYNEKNLIEKNDLTKYQTYDEIHNQVVNSEFKLKEKELEKQVVKIFENDEWLMLKPLVFESSLKYGYGTKWCTSMENDKTYFNKYTKEGILIYFINKVTNHKVAVYRKMFDGKSGINTPEITFWNEVDKQIDSFNSGLPGYLLDELRKHYEKHPITNQMVYEYITKTDKKGFKPESKIDNNEQQVKSNNVLIGFDEEKTINDSTFYDVDDSDEEVVEN